MTRSSMTDASLRAYLQQRVVIDATTGCWEWTKARDKDGYGAAPYQPIRRTGRAHRLAWMAFRGEMPEGEMVLHTCDNPPCINPDHLYVGDGSDNMRDAVARGRHAETRKTACIEGHPFDQANTYINPSSGQRVCKACQAAKWGNRYA